MVVIVTILYQNIKAVLSLRIDFSLGSSDLGVWVETGAISFVVVPHILQGLDEPWFGALDVPNVKLILPDIFVGVWGLQYDIITVIIAEMLFAHVPLFGLPIREDESLRRLDQDLGPCTIAVIVVGVGTISMHASLISYIYSLYINQKYRDCPCSHSLGTDGSAS